MNNEIINFNTQTYINEEMLDNLLYIYHSEMIQNQF